MKGRDIDIDKERDKEGGEEMGKTGDETEMKELSGTEKGKRREGGQSAQEVCPHECSGSLYHY